MPPGYHSRPQFFDATKSNGERTLHFRVTASVAVALAIGCVAGLGAQLLSWGSQYALFRTGSLDHAAPYFPWLTVGMWIAGMLGALTAYNRSEVLASYGERYAKTRQIQRLPLGPEYLEERRRNERLKKTWARLTEKGRGSEAGVVLERALSASSGRLRELEAIVCPELDWETRQLIAGLTEAREQDRARKELDADYCEDHS